MVFAPTVLEQLTGYLVNQEKQRKQQIQMMLKQFKCCITGRGYLRVSAGNYLLTGATEALVQFYYINGVI